MDIKEQYQELARQLGLTFKEGINGLLESKVLQKLEDQMIAPEVPEFLKNDLIQKLLASVFLGMATGTYHGYEFFVYRGVTSHAKGRHTYYFKVNLAFPTPLAADLVIVPLGFFRRLWRSVFSGNTVFTGNRTFDAALDVTARDQARVGRLLGTQDVQDRLERFFQVYPSARISDHGISYKGLGEILPVDQARRVMDDMAEAASLFFPPGQS